MCGIAGIIDYETPLERHAPTLQRMREALRHRGPDGDGMELTAHAGLVHTRLAVIDPAGGQQPTSDPERRWWITYNGEVYNHRELRQDLASTWAFTSDCDTEVVLAAWVRWGERSLSLLNGMFAFFIWDAVRHEGVLVRDRLGVKPLAFARRGAVLAFASEASVLAGMHGPPRADTEAISEYLAAPCFSGVETSPFDDIEYLQPGHLMRITREGCCVEQWWEYALEIDDAIGAAELSACLERATRNVLVSDVPIAHFLSGGFDSSLIASLATRLSPARETAYTIDFEDQARFDYRRSLITKSDDTPEARAVAGELGLPHEIVSVKRAQLMRSIASVARANDALPAWEQEVAQHALAEVASKSYKVVLVGDASDETHYGYPFLLDERVTMDPAELVQRFGCVEVLRDGPAHAMHWATRYRELARRAGHNFEGGIDRTLATTYLVVKRWLPRLLHNGDIHTMRFGLEARVPFGDATMLDVARHISPTTAYRDGCEKRVLRQAAQGMMPERARTRPKSALPKDQNAAHLYAETLLALTQTDAWAPMERLVLTDAVRSLCARHDALTEQQRALCFRLICLFHWQHHHEVVIS